MREFFIAAAAIATLAGTAAAQRAPFSTISNQNIFGGSYSIEIYRVATDYPAGTGARVEPEGMVFHNGILYVSSDAPASESNGHLLAYAGGDLRFLPSSVGRFQVTNGAAQSNWGAEGLTVNTRGTGYGSFSGLVPNIVSVDSQGAPLGRTLGVQNLTTGTVDSAIGGFLNSDDIAFVPGANASADRFAVLNGGANPPSINWFTAANTPVATGLNTFSLRAGAKGLLYLSAADAALFSPLATGEALLVANSPDGGAPNNVNSLSLYTLDGTLLADSIMPTGIGAGLLGNIESLAFDSATRRLFIGDEAGANSQIAVLTIPTPAAATLLGLAGVAAFRRRRGACVR
jgi:hypothetical protein